MKRMGFILCILLVFSTFFLVSGCQRQKDSEKKLKEDQQTAQPSQDIPDTTEGKDIQPTSQDNNKVQIGQTQQAGPNQAKVGPVIEFESTVCDFGNVPPQSRNNGSFKFTNDGDEQLEIKAVRSTCGCTVAELKKKKYAPGESGEIKVTFTVSVRIGPIQKQIYVTSNDKKHPSITLMVKANVTKIIDYTPEMLNLSLKEQNAACPEITLESLDGKPFAITKFQSTPDCIAVDFEPSKEATKFVLKPQVDIQKLKQYLTGTVRIYLSHPDCSLITLRFNAPPEFQTRPLSIIVFKAEPKKPVVRDDIWLLNNYDEDFEVESTSSEKGFIKTLSSQKVSKTSYKFKLEITPPDKEEKSNSFQDSFIINIKGGRQVKVTCRGYYSK